MSYVSSCLDLGSVNSDNPTFNEFRDRFSKRMPKLNCLPYYIMNETDQFT